MNQANTDDDKLQDKQISADISKRMEEIKSEMECPKNFKCYEMSFENLCKAKDIGLKTYLECLEEKPQECKFSMSFGYSYFCQCPLRVYISKKLRK